MKKVRSSQAVILALKRVKHSFFPVSIIKSIHYAQFLTLYTDELENASNKETFSMFVKAEMYEGKNIH